MVVWPAADQHARRVDGQNGAHLVVLPLVVLAALQAGLPAPGAGDRHPDLQQPPQRGPLAQLGSEDVDLRVLVGHLEQRGQRPGLGIRVVVQQPDPLALRPRVPQPLEPDLDGLGVAGRAGDPVNVAERLLQQVGAPVLAARVDGHHAGERDRLRPDAGGHGGQPARAVVADEQRGDGGEGIGHDGSP